MPVRQGTPFPASCQNFPGFGSGVLASEVSGGSEPELRFVGGAWSGLPLLHDSGENSCLLLPMFGRSEPRKGRQQWSPAHLGGAVAAEDLPRFSAAGGVDEARRGRVRLREVAGGPPGRRLWRVSQTTPSSSPQPAPSPCPPHLQRHFAARVSRAHPVWCVWTLWPQQVGTPEPLQVTGSLLNPLPRLSLKGD